MTHLWPLDDVTIEDQVIPVDDMHEVVDYLRSMPPEVEAAKRQSVLRQRLKFYYGPAPKSAGENESSSILGQIAMRHMCRHAAEEKRETGPEREPGDCQRTGSEQA